jgi:hypothetical protein
MVVHDHSTFESSYAVRAHGTSAEECDRWHGSLKTPAMAAKLTGHPWTLG